MISVVIHNFLHKNGVIVCGPYIKITESDVCNYLCAFQNGSLLLEVSSSLCKMSWFLFSISGSSCLDFSGSFCGSECARAL